MQIKHYENCSPTIILTEKEVEEKISYSVATVDVQLEDGRIGRFFVNVAIGSDGKIRGEIATNKANGQTTRKVVTAHKWKLKN